MKRLICFCFPALSLCALDDSPWLGNPYQFNFESDISYSRYRYINGAEKQPSYAYQTYLTKEGVSFTTADSFEVEWEIELARTPRQLYGFRSSALGAKYRLFDDIEGDFLSLTFGASLRGVGGRSVRDVNSPYASYLNAEIAVCAGKEFTKKEDWTTRGYFATMAGLANRGSVWNRFDLVYEGKPTPSQVLKGFMEGYFGYGPLKKVDIDHFHGWGSVAHRSLDAGVQYRYVFSLWGELGLSYAYRFFARSYPQNAQTVQLSYYLPFSLF